MCVCVCVCVSVCVCVCVYVFVCARACVMKIKKRILNVFVSALTRWGAIFNLLLLLLLLCIIYLRSHGTVRSLHSLA